MLGQIFIVLVSCKLVCSGEQVVPREGHGGVEVLLDPDLVPELREEGNRLWVGSTGPISS